MERVHARSLVPQAKGTDQECAMSVTKRSRVKLLSLCLLVLSVGSGPAKADTTVTYEGSGEGTFTTVWKIDRPAGQSVRLSFNTSGVHYPGYLGFGYFVMRPTSVAASALPEPPQELPGSRPQPAGFLSVRCVGDHRRGTGSRTTVRVGPFAYDDGQTTTTPAAPDRCVSLAYNEVEIAGARVPWRTFYYVVTTAQPEGLPQSWSYRITTTSDVRIERSTGTSFFYGADEFERAVGYDSLYPDSVPESATVAGHLQKQLNGDYVLSSLAMSTSLSTGPYKSAAFGQIAGPNDTDCMTRDNATNACVTDPGEHHAYAQVHAATGRTYFWAGAELQWPR